MRSKNFIGIHTPKIMSGASEGGAEVFKLPYINGRPACLAQSPQLHKQMSICGGFGRVFEVPSVFRAENSNTHRHLCEFIGLDAEMEIKEHYFEVRILEEKYMYFIYRSYGEQGLFFCTQVCDIVDGLFVAIFNHLNENCKKDLESINRQYPFEPLKVKPCFIACYVISVCI